MKKSEFGKLVLAASVAAQSFGEPAQARTTDTLAGPGKEHVRVLDPVATISRLIQEQMTGWNRDCRLAEPKHTLNEDEQRILKRAESLLYDSIIPFMAEYESAVDLNTAYRNSGPDIRSQVQAKMESVMPALYEFQRLRTNNPSVVCPLRAKRRY